MRKTSRNWDCQFPCSSHRCWSWYPQLRTSRCVL